MAIIEIIDGSEPRKLYEVVRRETIIGRHPGCEIVLADTTVSRRHARVVCEKDGYFVEDLASQHGTTINGAPVAARTKLNHLDAIHIRDTILKFHETDRALADELAAQGSPLERPSAIITLKEASSIVGQTTNLNAEIKLRALLEITRTLGSSLDVKTMFPEILDRVFLIFPQATRGCVLLAESLQGNLVPQAIKRTGDEPDNAAPVSRAIAERVIGRGEAILSRDAVEDSRFGVSDSIIDLQIRSIMCAPLVSKSRKPLGMIQVETDGRKPTFTKDDLELLVNVANLAGQLVEHARLHEAQLQFDRQSRDLEIARQVQLHFLPEDRPQIPGYEVFDYYNAAEGVGGDYFAYIDLTHGRRAIAIGDVAGKGVSAALLMARLCSEVRYCLVTNASPTDAVRQLDRQMSKALVMGGFITFVLCILDPHTHELTVVIAGHMPPLCRRAATGTVEEIGRDQASPPLGVGAPSGYQVAVTRLEPGDTVFLYTDGVSEAANKHKELFGTARVHQIVAKSGGAEATVRKVLQEVRRFSRGTKQSDDVCIVSLARDA